MTRKLDRTQIADIARIVAPVTPEAVAHPPRNFELPARLYGATVAAYLGFLVVAAIGFASPGLLIPLAICAIYLVMAFGTAETWARIAPDRNERGLTWGEFRRNGIVTATGHCDAAGATLQVLILPVLVLAWGLVTATLYAALN